jgi:pimeloyl-ACP methyl ester carboxylesterase
MIDGLLQVVPVIAAGVSDEALPEPTTLVRDEALLVQINAELGPELAASFAELLVVQSPEIYARFKALLPGIQQSDTEFLARLQLHEAFSFELDRLAVPFHGPTLFLLGRQDAVVGFRRALDLVADYPRATVAVLDRAGHALPWEQADLFSALIREWLARVEEATDTSTH